MKVPNGITKEVEKGEKVKQDNLEDMLDQITLLKFRLKALITDKTILERNDYEIFKEDLINKLEDLLRYINNPVEEVNPENQEEGEYKQKDGDTTK